MPQAEAAAQQPLVDERYFRFLVGQDAARERLHAHTRRLRESLSDMGYPIHQGTEQIIALEAGLEPDTMGLGDRLESQGVFGAVFCAPATSRNRSLVRLTLSAALTEAELRHVEDAARAVAPVVRPWNWPIARRAALNPSPCAPVAVPASG